MFRLWAGHGGQIRYEFFQVVKRRRERGEAGGRVGAGVRRGRGEGILLAILREKGPDLWSVTNWRLKQRGGIVC